MTLFEFLKNNYGDAEVLEPPVFYNTPGAGIRFQLGNPDEQKYSIYLLGAAVRALKIFEDMFKPDTEVYFVVDTWNERSTRRVIRNISRLLSTGKFEYERYSGFEEDKARCRYSVQCKAKDLKRLMITKGLVSEENSFINNSRLYVVNKETSAAYHVYDDRGLDVIAPTKEPLQDLYEKYNNWILEYDRDAVDRMFDK